MAKFEIEIDDSKGEFVGTLPAEFGSILEKLRATSHGEGYGKGAQKAAEEAKQQIADAVKAEKLKLEAQMPLEKAKWDEIDAQNKLLRTQLDTAVHEGRKQLTSREEAHAVETTKRMDALAKRDAKIQQLVKSQLRGLAAQAGAREESLSELEVLLQSRIAFTDDMEPYVNGEDGTPAKTAAGNPLGMEAFVKQYLDNHLHHRKPAPGKTGDARRGASLTGQAGLSVNAEGARARVEQGDRSATAINELYLATRKHA